MRKNILVLLLVLIISLSGLAAAERGRVKIADNTVVADNGWPLRGENPRLNANQRSDDPAYWAELRDTFHMNTVRILVYREPQNWGCYRNKITDDASRQACIDKYSCHLWENDNSYCECCPCGNDCQCSSWYNDGKTDCTMSTYSPTASASDFDANNDGQLTGTERTNWLNFMDTKLLPLLDRWVDNAAHNGFYAIIDYHPVGGYDRLDAKEWWSIVAPRYKDMTNVIYEYCNEPSRWTPKSYNTDAIQFQRDGYNLLRSLAPDTHIILWSFPVPNGLVKQTVDKAPQIDYSDASVGFHIYGVNISSIQDCRADYPVMQTEVGGNNPAEYNNGVQLMEDQGISWITLDGTKKSPPITVTWDGDPYFSAGTCEEGSACDDGVACTEDDTCVSDECTGTPDDSLCPPKSGCSSARCTATGCIYSGCESAGSLALWLPLDGNLSDSSGNSNNGVNHGALWSQDCSASDECLAFGSPNSYISIPDSDSLDPGSGFTISLWYRPGSDSGTHSIFGKNNGNIYSGNSYGLMQSGSWLYFKVDDAGNNNLAPNWGPISRGIWHLLAGVFDGSTATLYVDGQSRASKADSTFGSVRTTTQPAYIGSPLAAWSLNGTIDDVRVYGKALSAQDILDLYNNAAGPSGICGTFADIDSDGQITISELIDYISSWKTGSVTIGSLIDAIGKWKGGC